MKNFLSVSVNNYVKGEYFNGYKEFNSEDELMDYLNSNSLDRFNKSIEVDEELKIKVISLYFNELKIIRHIVDDFNKNAPSEVITFWENQLKKEKLEKKKDGFVNWDIHLSYDERVGNLKNLLTDYVQNYLKGKIVYGYLGHNFRKTYHDDIFENQISKINKVVFDEKEYDKYELLGLWLTSSDASHFMDEHGEESYDVFSKIVEDSMKNILIRSLIYSNDSHKGTLKSTMNLCEKINERTVLIK